MELVMDLAIMRRDSPPWGRIVRGCMILTVAGLLCIGSWNYEDECVVCFQGDMDNPDAGAFLFSQNAEECRRNIGTAFGKADAGRCALTELPGMDTGLRRNTRKKPAEIEEYEPMEPPLAENKEEGISLVSMTEEEETVQMPSITKDREDILVIEEEKEDIPVIGRKEESLTDNEKEACAKDSGIKEISGFLVDEDGYITGVTERLNLTDGILIFTWDDACIGIRAGALFGLAGYVEEIYIPANIQEIEPDALDELASLAYIEAAEDHPCYYSEDGILYPR